MNIAIRMHEKSNRGRDSSVFKSRWQGSNEHFEKVPKDNETYALISMNGD